MIVYLFPVGLVSCGVNIVAERLDGSRVETPFGKNFTGLQIFSIDFFPPGGP